MPLLPHTLPPAQTGAPRHSFDESIFLLNEGGTVVAAQQKEPLLAVGESFWRAMHVLREERIEVEQALRSLSAQSFLFLAGDRPAVACCYFFARTRLFAIFLPEGDIRRCLSAPAAYADAFAARHLLLSRGALARYLPEDETLFDPTDRFLRDLERPLFDFPYPQLPIYSDEGKPLIEATALIDLLAWRIPTLADLFGVDMDADWSGLGFSTLPFPDFSWITATLFALFLAVRRAAVGTAIRLCATNEGADGPVIEARFTLGNPDDPLPELLPLSANAAMRNELFEVIKSPQDPAQLLLRFSMCRKELSILGVKVDPRFRY